MKSSGESTWPYVEPGEVTRILDEMLLAWTLDVLLVRKSRIQRMSWWSSLQLDRSLSAGCYKVDEKLANRSLAEVLGSCRCLWMVLMMKDSAPLTSLPGR